MIDHHYMLILAGFLLGFVLLVGSISWAIIGKLLENMRE
jgi:hypothetical protein